MLMSSEDFASESPQEDEKYDHSTRVRRLKNAVKRHGAVEKITDYRDHGDVVYLDVVFHDWSVPSGFADEFDAELVTAFMHWPEQSRLKRFFTQPPSPMQAAVFAVPLEVEKRVTR